MKRFAFLTYGIVAYLLFLGVYVWMGAFVGNLLPRSMDVGPKSPLAVASIINVLLVLAFGLQHSIMARPAFKAVWTQLIPKPIERSTYVLASCLVTALLLWQWRPIDVVVWNVSSEPFRSLLIGLFVLGWFMVPAVSMMINHFDLFGLRQVWLNFQGKPYSNLPFRTPMAYGAVRHPLYVGWAIFFWCTPVMTVGHLLFAGLLTSYILVAVIYEERDLIAHFGETYREYSRRIPRFVPRFTLAGNPSRSQAQRQLEVPAYPADVTSGSGIRQP
jgi:protein-S-isoprenylcysteine O-methyltransferase Ste14